MLCYYATAKVKQITDKLQQKLKWSKKFWEKSFTSTIIAPEIKSDAEQIY